jgi:hypothetical protein
MLLDGGRIGALIWRMFAQSPIEVAMAKYLALDCIKPGDIILSKEKTTQSRLIRGLSFSDFSHAQIAIHPMMWFESADLGVQYQIISPNSTFIPQIVWDRRKGQFRLGLELKGGNNFEVKRLSDAVDLKTRLDEHKFANKLIDVTSKYAFLNYAKLDKFLPLLRFKLGERRFFSLLANAFDKGGVEFYPGPFCSWLVASCYQDMGLSLFDVDAQRISPGALQRNRRLDTVSAVFEGDIKQLPPHFREVKSTRDQIEICYNLMSAYSQSADITKGMTEYVSDVGLFVSTVLSYIKLKNSGQTFDDKSDEITSRNIEILKSCFREQQKFIRHQVVKFYGGCANYISDFRSFNDCVKACQAPAPLNAHRWCETEGSCVLATERYSQLQAELKQVFT